MGENWRNLIFIDKARDDVAEGTIYFIESRYHVRKGCGSLRRVDKQNMFEFSLPILTVRVFKISFNRLI